MFQMLRLLPLLVMETTNPENEPDDPFLKIFREMNDKLSKITEYLPSRESEEDDHDSRETNTETSSEEPNPELQTPAANPTAETDREEVETESPPPKPRKRAPWDRTR